MLGGTRAYDEVPFFWTRQAGFGLTYVGFVREFDEAACRGSVEEGKFLAGYFQKGRLRAAATVGLRSELIAIEHLIRRGTPPTATQLADESFDLGEAARKS
jgi:3-phenylpropionate/trans-cinnamate dioxygenase ferredoxin reductase subunit